MADSITPTQPLTPSLPVTVAPDDKHYDKQKEPPRDNEQKQTDKNNIEKPKEGLFDDYA